MTHYEVLGISSAATQDEIRKVNRRTAFDLHPDRNKNQRAHRQFIRVRQAYEILSSPQKRLVYDQSINNLSADTPEDNRPNEYYERRGKSVEYNLTKEYGAIFHMSWKEFDTLSPKVIVIKLIVTFCARTCFAFFGAFSVWFLQF